MGTWNLQVGFHNQICTQNIYIYIYLYMFISIYIYRYMDTYAYRYIDVVICRDFKIFAENRIEFAHELNLRANSGPKRCCLLATCRLPPSAWYLLSGACCLLPGSCWCLLLPAGVCYCLPVSVIYYCLLLFVLYCCLFIYVLFICCLFIICLLFVLYLFVCYFIILYYFIFVVNNIIILSKNIKKIIILININGGCGREIPMEMYSGDTNKKKYIYIFLNN